MWSNEYQTTLANGLNKFVMNASRFHFYLVLPLVIRLPRTHFKTKCKWGLREPGLQKKRWPMTGFIKPISLYQGGTVLQWLALSPQCKKVLSFNLAANLGLSVHFHVLLCCAFTQVSLHSPKTRKLGQLAINKLPISANELFECF